MLTQLKQQQIVFSHELGDRLAHCIVAIHRLVHEAVTGESAGVDSFHVLAVLMGSDAEKGGGAEDFREDGRERVGGEEMENREEEAQVVADSELDAIATGAVESINPVSATLPTLPISPSSPLLSLPIVLKLFVFQLVAWIIS